MATGITPVKDEALEEELTRLGLHKGFVTLVFLLVCTPGLFNTWHTSNYVFFASGQDFYCDIPDLAGSKLTSEQIRLISAPPVPAESASKSTCQYYDYDYKAMADMSFEDAKAAADKQSKKLRDCDKIVYGETTSNITSIVEEWDLVCNRDWMKAFTQNSVVFGKFLGAFVFGFAADKFGRLMTIQASIILYFIFGLVNYFTDDYWLFCFCRVILGMAGSGTFNTGITLLMEICDARYRSLLGVLYNIPYSIGMFTMAGIAYGCNTWQEVILYMTVPMYIMVFHIFFLPESPRWAIQRGYAHRAWFIVKKSNLIMDKMCCTPIPATTQERIDNAPKVKAPKVRGPEIPVKERIAKKLRENIEVCKRGELIKRLLICWYLWPAAAFSYYVLNISSDNLGVNTYAFIALSGVPEAISYIFPIPLIQYFGRRLTSVGLYLIGGCCLFFIVMIPREQEIAILVLSMIARLCAAAVFGVVILYTSELFPTDSRSTAVGTSSTMCHLSGLISATVVDELGKLGWYLPTCLCGVICFIACVLSSLLPETKGTKAPDTYEEMMQGDLVSIKNMFKFKLK